jgi:hypothetical protein
MMGREAMAWAEMGGENSRRGATCSPDQPHVTSDTRFHIFAPVVFFLKTQNLSDLAV